MEELKIIDIEKARKKARIREAVEEVKQKAVVAGKWVVANGGKIVAVGLPVAGMALKIIGVASRKHAIKQEQNLKDLYCYDRSLGHYWELRRKLTNADWLKINELKANGESLGDILADMGVLKR